MKAQKLFSFRISRKLMYDLVKSTPFHNWLNKLVLHGIKRAAKAVSPPQQLIKSEILMFILSTRWAFHQLFSSGLGALQKLQQ